MYHTVKIDLVGLQKNYLSLQKRLQGQAVIAVLKADAYGHGAVRCAEALYEVGCRFFAVADLWEAVTLRTPSLHGCNILILGETPPAYADILSRYRLTQSVHSLPYACALSRSLCADLYIHLKFDCGMHRFGFSCDGKGLFEARCAARQKHLRVRGAFSHFAQGGQPDSDRTRAQRAQTDALPRVLSDALKAHTDTPLLFHFSNSDALCAGMVSADAVRLGISLYGYPCMPIEGVAPILRWQSRIVDCRTVQKGEWVGYGEGYCTKEAELLFTVPVGYADGFLRAFAGASVPHANQTARVAAVCMDATIFSVPVSAAKESDVAYGQEVTLLSEECDARFWADYAKTIPYEILCRIGTRQQRIYCTSP